MNSLRGDVSDVCKESDSNLQRSVAMARSSSVGEAPVDGWVVVRPATGAGLDEEGHRLLHARIPDFCDFTPGAFMSSSAQSKRSSNCMTELSR